MLLQIKAFIESTFLVYFFVINTTYFVLLAISLRFIRQQMFQTSYNQNIKQILKPSFIPGISILIPAFNEQKTLVKNILSLMMLNYPQFEVIIINDGSSDKTIELLQRTFDLEKAIINPTGHLKSKAVKQLYRSRSKPNLIILDKINGGKADSLNCGLNYVQNPYFCCIDADVILDPDGLIKLMRPFLENPEEVVATSGIIRVANNCILKDGRVDKTNLPKKLIPTIQVTEYIRAFLFGRLAFSTINGLLIISGAFGAFATEQIRNIGGYRTDTISEDMELVVRLHHHLRLQKKPYKVLFLAEPVCWTEVPTSLHDLSRQRQRWHQGLCEVLWKYREMFLNRKFGAIGFISMPYFIILELFGSILEVFGYTYAFIMLSLGLLDVRFNVLFLTFAILYGIFLSLASIVLEDMEFKWYTRPKSVLKLAIVSIIENFGYRQMVAFWRFQGIINFLRKNKNWGKAERQGFN